MSFFYYFPLLYSSFYRQLIKFNSLQIFLISYQMINQNYNLEYFKDFHNFIMSRIFLFMNYFILIMFIMIINYLIEVDFTHFKNILTLFRIILLYSNIYLCFYCLNILYISNNHPSKFYSMGYLHYLLINPMCFIYIIFDLCIFPCLFTTINIFAGDSSHF